MKNINNLLEVSNSLDEKGFSKLASRLDKVAQNLWGLEGNLNALTGGQSAQEKEMPKSEKGILSVKGKDSGGFQFFGTDQISEAMRSGTVAVSDVINEVKKLIDQTGGNSASVIRDSTRPLVEALLDAAVARGVLPSKAPKEEVKV